MADAAPDLKTPTDLKRNATRSVADALNASLADCYALYLKTKNFHWHVSGPHFRDYHLLMDDQAAQILGVTDAIAERVRKTGNTTLRSIGDIGRRQTIVDNDREFVSAVDMLAELRDDNLKLVESFRAVKDAADDAKDNATSGIVDEWTDQAEERAWFLFEASRKVEGDTDMLKWAVIFLVVGLILGALGFGGIGGAFVGLAKILFFIALALFAIFLVLGLMAGKTIKDAVD